MGERPVSSVTAPSRVDTRPGQRRPRCHVGRQAAEVAQWWVSTKIRMPPRRCLPSWLGRQLHANGGGGLTGVGLMVALRVFLARALPGPRQGSCRGPALIPGKALSGGLVVLLGWDPAKDHHLLKGVSDLECLHKVLHATTGMSPESLPHGGSGLKGDSLHRCGASCHGKGLAGFAKTASRQ